MRSLVLLFVFATVYNGARAATAAGNGTCDIPEEIKNLYMAVGKPAVVAGIDACEANSHNISSAKLKVAESVAQEILTSAGAAVEIDNGQKASCCFVDYHYNALGCLPQDVTCDECNFGCYCDTNPIDGQYMLVVSGQTSSGAGVFSYKCPVLCDTTLQGNKSSTPFNPCTPEMAGTFDCPPCTMFCACYAFVWGENEPSQPWQGPCKSIVGDPHLVGFDGTEYDFMGYKDGIFSLYSDASHQINMLLDDFGFEGLTFMKSLGYLYADDVKIEVQTVNPGGFNVIVNGETLANDTNIVKVLGKDSDVNFRQIIVGPNNKRLFVTSPQLTWKVWKSGADTKHLDSQISFLYEPKEEDVHGVLGQSLRWVGENDPIFDGEEEDYLVDSLLGVPAKYNKFEGARAASLDVSKTKKRRGKEVSHENDASQERRRQLLGNDDVAKVVQTAYVSGKNEYY